MNSLTFQKQQTHWIIQNQRHDRKIFYRENPITFFGIFDEKFAIPALRNKNTPTQMALTMNAQYNLSTLDENKIKKAIAAALTKANLIKRCS